MARAVAVLLLLSPGGCGWGTAHAGNGTGATREAPPPAEDRAPLEPGDRVRVALSREEGLGGEFPVDSDGIVSLPILGATHVGDRAAAEVRRSILEHYREQLRNQTIDVQVLRRVRVLGEVRQPGVFYLDPTMTVRDAVAVAGGGTSTGDLRDVRLVRGGREHRTDLTAAGEPPVPVASGDQVLVPQKSWFARNSALVASGTISALGFLIGLALF